MVGLCQFKLVVVLVGMRCDTVQACGVLIWCVNCRLFYHNMNCLILICVNCVAGACWPASQLSASKNLTSDQTATRFNVLENKKLSQTCHTVLLLPIISRFPSFLSSLVSAVWSSYGCVFSPGIVCNNWSSTLF